jgi:hypothetical protein
VVDPEHHVKDYIIIPAAFAAAAFINRVLHQRTGFGWYVVAIHARAHKTSTSVQCDEKVADLDGGDFGR